ncbi:hypothetical protein [uncultured Winogradskyella sp.]|uniref:hypothetical protein n=1 Tax=uncultured Winogradskyella sp. TaxID=395353 RepID=UPI0026331259|nr:hypothetical protein [uncultured Winogradskyella sp.]
MLKRIRLFIYLVTLFSFFLVNAQRKELKGKLMANDEVEGLHILNRTASSYAISEDDGSFRIKAKALDTLLISGLKYETTTHIVSQLQEASGQLSIQLIEKINALDKVIVGKILTGSLESDLENSDAKTEINFYDLGIPGNTNLPLTQNERKLHDAESGGPIYTGLGLNVHKLLNRISGRTNKLKVIVDLDNRDKCITRLRTNYESIIFENVDLDENLKVEYFLFCQEDAQFLNLCNQKNEIKLIEYLHQKLKDYQKNRASLKKD